MTIPYFHANTYLQDLLQQRSPEELGEALRPKPEQEPASRIPRDHRISPRMVEQRWTLFPTAADAREQLLDPVTVAGMDAYQRNIENFIGTVKLPVGIAGPLRANGLFAQGDYYVPLATTEAALVASYNRGAQLITRAGGCTTLLLSEAVMRAPGFAFDDLREAGAFVAWAVPQLDNFKAEAAKTTRHGELIDMQVSVEGNHVYLRFDYHTGDAAGQNMVTIATQAICDYIKACSPVTPRYSFLEANLSGDKKASWTEVFKVCFTMGGGDLEDKTGNGQRSGTVGNLTPAVSGFGGLRQAYFTRFPGRDRTRPNMRLGSAAESGRRHAMVAPEKSAAIRVTSLMAVGFGHGDESSDQRGHGCYWNQHVEMFLVSQPHRKAPTRNRSTQGER